MKKLIIITLGLLLALEILAQKSEVRKLSSFEKVSVATGIDAILSQGSTEQVKIEAEGIDMDEIVTEVSSGQLKVYIDKNNIKSPDVTVYITYKTLTGLKASSAGNIKVTDPISIKGEFEVDASSAGEIEASIEATEVEIDASSAAEITLKVETMSLVAAISSAADVDVKGWAKKLEVEASSSGEFSGDELLCDEAELKASSGADITAKVKEKIEARASSGGSIRYGGSPRYVDKESSSGGSIRND